jgi:hypothetical protein
MEKSYMSWENCQAFFASNHLSFESETDCVAWLSKVRSLEKQNIYHDRLIQTHQAIINLLQVIIADTDAAAQSMISEISIVNEDTSKLSEQVKSIAEKTQCLPSITSDRASRLTSQVAQLLEAIAHTHNNFSSLDRYIQQASGSAGEVHQSVKRMIMALSFKATLETAQDEGINISLLEVGEQLRSLAKKSEQHSEEILKFIDELQITLKQSLSSIDLDTRDRELTTKVLSQEIVHILSAQSDMSTFLGDMIQVFSAGHDDIWDKVRMMYAQVQFQDIVRQKAERGIHLLESTIASLQCDNPDEALQLLCQSIEYYQETEQLHSNFHHSGVDATHGGGKMSIDLF